jgi:copper(I)-binding protein
MQNTHAAGRRAPSGPRCRIRRDAAARRAITRRLIVAAAALALPMGMSGCAGHSVSAPHAVGPRPQGSGTPGTLSIPAALTIRHAQLEPGPDRSEDLVMAITNTSSIPDHLYALATTHAAGIDLLDAPTTPGASPVPAGSAGIALPPGSPVDFGPGGPQILLENPTGLTTGAPVTLTLFFAVTGMVHLTVVPTAKTFAPSTAPSARASSA